MDFLAYTKRIGAVLLLAAGIALAQSPGANPIGWNSSVVVANQGTTGTTVNHLVKMTGAPSTAIITSTSDTTGAVGIVVGGAGTTGSATIVQSGRASCIFDSNGVTAGDYVIISSVSGGDCADGGTTPPATEVIGYALATVASGAADVQVLLGRTLTGGAVNPKSLQDVQYANQFSGSDIGAQIVACIAALPATGGVCDASAFQGAQSSPGFSVSKANLTVLFGAATIKWTSAIEIDASNVIIEGHGIGATVFVNDATGTGNCSLYPTLQGDDLIRSSTCSSSTTYSGTKIENLTLDGNRISASNQTGIDPNVGASPVSLSSAAQSGTTATIVLSASIPTALQTVGNPVAVAGVTGSCVLDGVYPIVSVNAGTKTITYTPGTTCTATDTATSAYAGVFNDITQNGYNGTVDTGTTLQNVYSHDNYGIGAGVNGNGSTGSTSCQFMNVHAAYNGESGLLVDMSPYSAIQGGEGDHNGQSSDASAIEISGLSNGDYSHNDSISGVKVHDNTGSGIDLLDSSYDTVTGNNLYSNAADGISARDQGSYAATRERIVGNSVSGGTTCISVSNATSTENDSVVTGNAVSGCSTTGISDSESNDVAITGNQVYDITATSGSNAGIGVNANGVTVTGNALSTIASVPGVDVFGGADNVVESNLIDPASVTTPTADAGTDTIIAGNSETGTAGKFQSSVPFLNSSTASPQFDCSVASGDVCSLGLNQSGIVSWTIRNDAASGKLAFYDGNTEQFLLSPSTGAASFPGTLTAGGLEQGSQQVILAGANGISAGTVTISSATSGSHTFTTAYSAAPTCTASEGTSSPTSLIFGVTSTTTAVTVTLSTSGSGTFTFMCVPPNN